MLDPKQLRAGSRIRLEGAFDGISSDGEFYFGVDDSGKWLPNSMLKDATLISQPAVKFTREQVGALKEWRGEYHQMIANEEGKSFAEWLEEHVEG